ncbi:serine/threonine-protein kinase [Streptomyces sp. PU10]|uniref:serine/threonine-protein kinase n=1 Tax=unclassified Streptomyces TaxID=2593676 RepID=UPI001590E459|nr:MULTISPECIES: serine/threonine-protein kinase [unclassified Streptomyces]MBH5133418.1 serine/threonine protein kinase [Streptomyces sp. HB-N217]MDU0255746.1 serine/threonine-protein kinase [Streptomyces sp. PU10]QKW65680.1 serine/threonine protein kinase [Streptomyces sp. NA03103]WSU06036.1 protein kinase [Streptomyces sp. NBC_01124]
MSEAERAGTSRTDKSARLLAGRYRLGDVLGRGGMGTVWRAEDETLGRTVAVKELRFPGNIDEEEKRRLITRTLREAKAIARIRNNSAVTVYDVVEEDDRPWIVMELVEGKSLAEAIREDGLLEPKRAAEVGLAILDVLRSAHREGILHRDVKPSNVLIAEDGRVVLTDFGIAQVEGDPSITSTGMLVGAPSYISPERARGHKPGPAADLWSLGGLLYAAVEGVPPYDRGSAIATLTAVMTENLEEPKNAGPLRDVIYGLLNKDPDQRLDDAGARAMLNRVIHAPERAAGAEPVDATKVVPLPPQPDGRGRRGGSAGTGAKRAEEAGEKLRGALRSVRKAAVGAGAAGAAAASRTRPGDGGGTAAGAARATRASGAAGAPGSAGSAGSAGATAAAPAPRVGSGAGAVGGGAGRAVGSGAGASSAAGGAKSSGWPVVPPPDLPARSVPRAPLTDVVPRRTLIIIAVVVALAVLGTVLALTLGGGDDDKGAEGGSGGKAVASAGASGDTKQDEGSGTSTDGSASDPTTDGAASGAPDTAASASGEDEGESDDAGKSDDDENVAATHQGDQGYRIGLPKGWKFASTGSAGDRFTGPGGQKLLVAWTSTPKGDPVADWKNQERYMVRSNYKKIRIEKVGYRDWNAADWEFTYTDGGTKYRTVDRGFVVNDHQGYALMYTAKAADWGEDLRRDTWRTLSKTFEPKS